MLFRLPQKDWETPLAHTHFKAEGDVEFKAVMFLPSQAAPGECSGWMGGALAAWGMQQQQQQRRQHEMCPPILQRCLPPCTRSLQMCCARPASPPPAVPPGLYRTLYRPADAYDNYYSKKPSIKLYVRRVFISENFEDLLPK